jgi:hypothetical protein
MLLILELKYKLFKVVGPLNLSQSVFEHFSELPHKKVHWLDTLQNTQYNSLSEFEHFMTNSPPSKFVLLISDSKHLTSFNHVLECQRIEMLKNP